jgi:NAD(P)-dependent dehydrogenase (short-subunit alcohol dehydrogenase family)
LVEQIQQQGGETVAVIADVAEFQQAQVIADKAIAQFGRLDTWVHLSANGILAPFEDITPTEFKRVVGVTFLGQVYGAMVALPHLKREGRGALIHITSVEARRSIPLQSPYSASKHGVEGFLETLRVELKQAEIPISVTNIMPAVINTQYYDKIRTKIGVKPTGIPPYPELVADAILYCAEHPTRDFIVGDVGKVIDVLQRISPSLLDSLLLLIGFQGQKTNEVKAADAPTNLFEPIQGFDKVEGDFGHLAIPSVTDWLDKNPALKWGTIAATLVGLSALTLLSAQTIKSGTSS